MARYQFAAWVNRRQQKTRLGGRVLKQPIGVGFMYFFVLENDMSHPKNTTAPPKAQHLPRSLSDRAGFTYFEVQVVYEEAGFKRSYPGVLDEAIARELKSILEQDVSPRSVRIIWAAGWSAEFEEFLRMDERMTDLIKSVRSAERPGYELCSRLGQFGPYVGYAPRSAQSQNVAPDTEVQP
ncbi:hypothetical protein [Pseudomonas marginalis]|uniref:hypothetical protein n=1 Tax=Pseudomonas marginalis TaxID=298 RepID=UPI0011B6ED9B|nr:hypothetical protein [Pseudomonas marginalis]TWR71854.1 hypothetical protein FIV40_09115 [Pseudomonas marginalis]